MTVYEIAHKTIRGPIRDLILANQTDDLRPIIADIMSNAIDYPVLCEKSYNSDNDINIGGYICIAKNPSIDISKRSTDWRWMTFFTGPRHILQENWPWNYHSTVALNHVSSRYDCGCARCVGGRQEVKIWTNLTQRYNFMMMKIFD